VPGYLKRAPSTRWAFEAMNGRQRGGSDVAPTPAGPEPKTSATPWTWTIRPQPMPLHGPEMPCARSRATFPGIAKYTTPRFDTAEPLEAGRYRRPSRRAALPTPRKRPPTKPAWAVGHTSGLSSTRTGPTRFRADYAPQIDAYQDGPMPYKAGMTPTMKTGPNGDRHPQRPGGQSRKR